MCSTWWRSHGGFDPPRASSVGFWLRGSGHCQSVRVHRGGGCSGLTCGWRWLNHRVKIDSDPISTQFQLNFNSKSTSTQFRFNVDSGSMEEFCVVTGILLFYCDACILKIERGNPHSTWQNVFVKKKKKSLESLVSLAVASS